MPDLTPAHQVVLQTGMMGSIGGFDFLLPMIWGNLKNTSDIFFPWLRDLSEIWSRLVPGFPETLPTFGIYGGVLRIIQCATELTRVSPHVGVFKSRPCLVIVMNCYKFKLVF